MPDCCTSKSEHKPVTLKQTCPVCGQAALEVSTRTMLQHIKDVWRYKFSEEAYYFCRTEDCDVIYFTKKSGEKLIKAEIRTTIGIKEQDDSSLICYCFGVSKEMAATDKTAKEFVIKQTKESTCACETANPSGRCCLKDFSRLKN